MAKLTKVPQWMSASESNEDMATRILQGATAATASGNPMASCFDEAGVVGMQIGDIKDLSTQDVATESGQGGEEGESPDNTKDAAEEKKKRRRNKSGGGGMRKS